MSVGVPDIDRDHLALIGIFNELEGAAKVNRADEVVADVLIRLADYASHHFMREEAVMVAIAYPQLDKHRRQHADLLRGLSTLVYELETGQTRVTADTMHFLRNWLTIHIMEHDRALGASFKKRRGTAA